MKASRPPRGAPGDRRRSRGSVAVEAALTLPFLIGIGLVGSDMQRIHTERLRIENAAGALALNVSAQAKLTAAGLDALATVAMQGKSSAQQLTVLFVEASGRVTWALTRGGAAGLCTPPVAGGVYTGEWPADQKPTGEEADEDKDENDDAITRPQIVVQACARTSEVLLAGGLSLPDVLTTLTIYPASYATLTLDDTLKAESLASGLAYPEEP